MPRQVENMADEGLSSPMIM